MAALALLAAACSSPFGATPTPAPAPSIRTEGQDVKCPSGDHGIDEVQFGWSWCYPASWRFQERLQPTACNQQTNPDGTVTDVCAKPKGVDATYDIVNDLPAGQPGSGDFGFLIVGTYELGGQATLADWMRENFPSTAALTPISWGNAKEAGIDAAGHRFALTPTHVVEMDVRGETISAEMAKRLDTWKFD